ncbi:MAG: hypothetical protein ABI537_14195 [Casimicrobiaceae bacterium]
MRRGLQWMLIVAVVFGGGPALAAAQDDLLHREALKSDQRMFDNFQAFAKALRAALGSEPKLAALEVSENTGSALVRSDDGQTHSFTFVEGKLTEARSNLRDEAPADEALTGRFTFDAIDLNRVRAALKTQRARPGHSGDTAPELTVRYRTIVGRWMVAIQLGSMASNGMDLVSYDFHTGEAVDLKGIVGKRNAEVEAHNTRVRAEQKAFDDEQKRLEKINMLGLGAEAVQALSRDVGATLYLRNVVIEVKQIRLTFNDPRARGETVTYRYNRAKKLTRLDTIEAQVTKCEEPFPAEDFAWTQVPQFVEQAFVAIGADRSAEIRVDVERPDKCGPVHAQVSLDKNHHINGAYFDRGGRLYRVD